MCGSKVWNVNVTRSLWTTASGAPGTERAAIGAATGATTGRAAHPSKAVCAAGSVAEVQGPVDSRARLEAGTAAGPSPARFPFGAQAAATAAAAGSVGGAGSCPLSTAYVQWRWKSPIRRRRLNFTLKFLIVKNKEKIQGIANASEQSFIATTDYVVVIYSDPSRLINLFSERGKRYSRQQAGAAIENFWLSLIDKGLSTCWVGHFDDDMIKKLLKIPNKMELEAVFPIGYDSGKTKRRKRLDLDRILYFDSHGNKKMKTPYNPEA